MENILQAKQVLVQYNDGSLTDEEQVLQALDQLDEAEIDKAILAETKVGRTVSSVVKGNKAPNVVAKATALQKKWMELVKEQKGTGTQAKRKREENSPTEEPATQKRKLETATKTTTTVKMEKAVRSQPAAIKTEKPVAAKSEKPMAVKSEKSVDVKPEKAVKSEPAQFHFPDEKKTEPETSPVKEEKPEKNQEKPDGTGHQESNKVPVAVTNFQGNSTDKKRNRIQQRLWEALGSCGIQGGTESSIIAGKIEEAMWVALGTDEKKYQAKFRSLFSNLKDAQNQGLRNALFTGDLQVTRLIQMTHEELANPALQESRRKLKQQQIAARQDYKPTASCTMFTCHKCGKNETTYFQLQTRSADEPMTTFITCITCGHHWRC